MEKNRHGLTWIWEHQLKRSKHDESILCLNALRTQINCVMVLLFRKFKCSPLFIFPHREIKFLEIGFCHRTWAPSSFINFLLRKKNQKTWCRKRNNFWLKKKKKKKKKNHKITIQNIVVCPAERHAWQENWQYEYLLVPGKRMSMIKLPRVLKTPISIVSKIAGYDIWRQNLVQMINWW